MSFSKNQKMCRKLSYCFLFFAGFHLLEPTKIVIDNYLSSSRALPLRAQTLGSQANISSRDAFLQSFLSCLFGWSFTSKSVSRRQPKRCFNPGYHYVVLDLMQYPTLNRNLAEPLPFAKCLHRVPMLLYYKIFLGNV